MPPKRQRVMIKRDILSSSPHYTYISKKVLKLYNQQNDEIKYVPCLIDILNREPRFEFCEHETITIKFNNCDIYCTTKALSDYMATDYRILKLYRLRLESETEETINNFIISSTCGKQRNTPALYEYNLDHVRWEKRKNLEETFWESYVITQAKKTKIITRIDNFLNSRAEYIKHNKNYKLVFLLIGPPGTGKSTLCKLIAQYTKRNMYAISMDATITDNIFSELYNKIINNSVVVLEDLDRIYSKQSGNHTAVSLSALLNIFDGAQTLQDNIVIITANDTVHFEDALTRSGRIDEIIEFSYICEEECHQAFEIFNCNNFTDNDIKLIINICMINNITTCELTDFLFQNRVECSRNKNVDGIKTHNWGKLFQEYAKNIKGRASARKNTPQNLYM